jgi:hypothetical protein
MASKACDNSSGSWSSALATGEQLSPQESTRRSIDEIAIAEAIDPPAQSSNRSTTPSFVVLGGAEPAQSQARAGSEAVACFCGPDDEGSMCMNALAASRDVYPSQTVCTFVVQAQMLANRC